VQFDDLKQELSKIRNMVAKSELLIKQREFQEAKMALEAVVEAMEVAYPEEHPDYVLSLSRLGDVYYELGLFGLAASQFELVYKLKSKYSQLAGDFFFVRFKLARCLDKAGKPQEAAQNYELLLKDEKFQQSADEILEALIWESYGQCLGRQGVNGRKLEWLLKDAKKRLKTKTIKKVRNNSLAGGAFLDEEFGSVRESLKTYISSERSVLFADAAINARAKVPALGLLKKLILSTLVLFVFVVLFYFATIQHKESPIVPKAAVGSTELHAALSRVAEKLKGKQFSSLDGSEKLVFAPDGDVSLYFNNEESSVSCFDKGTIPDVLARNNRKFVFRDGVLVDQNGTVLFSAGSRQLDLAGKMESICKVLQGYYQSNQEYPDDKEKLQQLLSGIADLQGRLQLNFLGRLKSPDEINQLSEKLRNFELLAGDVSSPEQVYCYYVLTGDAASGLKSSIFAMRVSDANSHFISAQKSGGAYLILLNQGIKISPNGIPVVDSSKSRGKVQAIRLEEE
jgi:hypothetical protein